MELHNYQEARLKLFEDKFINKVWVFPKNAARPFPLSASKITVETDFQTPDLESFQQKIETRAARALREPGKWKPEDYDAISEWAVLHLIRNRKSRKEFFSSPKDFNNRFISEFKKELTISRNRYPNVDIYGCKPDRFLITSDHPVVELQVHGERDYVRCFEKSPQIIILFSERTRPPEFEIAIEDFFNAMVYAVADQFVFSHRRDVCVETLKRIKEKFDIFPTIGE
jgi:hypothetical protein